MKFQPVAVGCLLWAALHTLPVWAQDNAPGHLVISQPAGGLAESQLNLRWDPVPGALSYEVLRKRNGKWWLNEEDPSCTPITNSTSITGLSPDTPVEFCVRAVLPKGLSAAGPAVTARTIPLGTALLVRPSTPAKPLPVVDEPADPVPTVRPSPPVKTAVPDSDPVPITSSITDLVPPPPKPKATIKEPESKGPPPPTPEGLMGLFSGGGDIRLSWRVVSEATGYLVEEERDGQWVTVEDGVIQENRPSLIVKGRGAGPYLFRVRAIRNGRRSSVSLPTKVER